MPLSFFHRKKDSRSKSDLRKEIWILTNQNNDLRSKIEELEDLFKDIESVNCNLVGENKKIKEQLEILRRINNNLLSEKEK